MKFFVQSQIYWLFDHGLPTQGQIHHYWTSLQKKGGQGVKSIYQWPVTGALTFKLDLLSHQWLEKVGTPGPAKYCWLSNRSCQVLMTFMLPQNEKMTHFSLGRYSEVEIPSISVLLWKKIMYVEFQVWKHLYFWRHWGAPNTLKQGTRQ